MNIELEQILSQLKDGIMLEITWENKDEDEEQQ